MHVGRREERLNHALVARPFRVSAGAVSIMVNFEYEIIPCWECAAFPAIGYEKKAQDLIVHSGEDFGIGVRFTSIKPKPKIQIQIQIQIKLVVPSAPENFPCGTCKLGELTISKDGHTIIINKEVAESRGQTAFYWGIAASDPRGKYQMSLSFDGVQIETYNFEVK